MRLPARFLRRIEWRLRRVARSREPDFVVGGSNDPYLRRWWIVPRNRWLNVYLHHFLRSDDDRALHDHPWCSVSVMLRRGYVEHLPRGRWLVAQAGDVIFRRARSAHRIEVVPGCDAWTLFITGPRVREWGFHCPQGWRPWFEFVDPADRGSVGPGCD